MGRLKNNLFHNLDHTSDFVFQVNSCGVIGIKQSLDHKIQLVKFQNGKLLMGVVTRNSFISYYPILPVKLERPIKAVLMDLDGTTLYSEDFWISVIQETVRIMTTNTDFGFSDSDLPFVSGHSVSEHLSYCIEKYHPGFQLDRAINIYYQIADKMLKQVLNGEILNIGFEPAYFLKEFLEYLHKKSIKVGLVTSGVYEKAYPEIWSVCSKLKLGAPEEVYDSIITAGNPLRNHSVGNLGELSAKPHPWLYLEEALVGLSIDVNDRKHVLGIEDSGAGICSLASAGIPAIGLTHGNIIKSGLDDMCMDICDSLEEILNKYFTD